MIFQEQEELITDWQPEPLVPDTNEDHPALDPFVVEGKVCCLMKTSFIIFQYLWRISLGWQVCLCQRQRLP